MGVSSRAVVPLTSPGVYRFTVGLRAHPITLQPSQTNPNCPDCLVRAGDTPAGDRVVCPDCGQAQQWNPESAAWVRV